MPVPQFEIFEIFTDRWLAWGLAPGDCLPLDRRVPQPGDLVVARVNSFLILGIWMRTDAGTYALAQPGRVVRLSPPAQVRILGVLVR